MFKIKGTTIHCTRGDRGVIRLTVPLSTGELYPFQIGDIIAFTVKPTFDIETPVLRKEYTIDTQSTSVELVLERNDTTIGQLISEPVEYQYDICLNKDETLIGYDEKGSKAFILYPEGGDND